MRTIRMYLSEPFYWLYEKTGYWRFGNWADTIVPMITKEEFKEYYPDAHKMFLDNTDNTEEIDKVDILKALIENNEVKK